MPGAATVTKEFRCLGLWDFDDLIVGDGAASERAPTVPQELETNSSHHSIIVGHAARGAWPEFN